MLLKDQTTIWIASKQSEMVYGQAVTTYTNPRQYIANVQHMSNEEEQKIYGVITSAVIVIRTSSPVQALIGDGIYFAIPLSLEQVPEYSVTSVTSARIGVTSVMNPMKITARKGMT